MACAFVSVGRYAGKEAQNRVPLAVFGNYEDQWIFTSPVGSFDANKYGLYDMGGNVRQWCEDRYNSTKDSRVARGGSWDDFIDSRHEQLLSSYRGHVSWLDQIGGDLPLPPSPIALGRKAPKSGSSSLATLCNHLLPTKELPHGPSGSIRKLRRGSPSISLLGRRC
jgi:hypothetical protein